MNDIQTLITALKSIADTTWDATHRPVLLSHVPRLLADGFSPSEYKAILKGRSLKALILETGPAAGYKLIEHPTIKARVAIAPISANYDFPSEKEIRQKHLFSVTSDRREALFSFVQGLSLLPERDLEKINIPASALVRLLK